LHRTDIANFRRRDKADYFPAHRLPKGECGAMDFQCIPVDDAGLPDQIVRTDHPDGAFLPYRTAFCFWLDCSVILEQ
jgi:hypothetical protein